MSATIVERLAVFAAYTGFADIPSEATIETKRILIDSVGCALAAIGAPKGRIGIDIAAMMGGRPRRAFWEPTRDPWSSGRPSQTAN